MKKIDFRTYSTEQIVQAINNQKKTNPTDESLEDLSRVQEIIQQVRLEGDAALLRYSQAFDGYGNDTFLVSPAEFEEAQTRISDHLKRILKEAKTNIEAYHRHQVTADWSFSPKQGILMGQRIRPIQKVALYIPGGKAAYPSTVLMNGIPALLAGVGEISIFTPPDSSGKVSPLVLCAAKLLGISNVYKLGGAQAIAAAAYGTEQIPKADKIVGPGNRYVTLAKKLVFGDVAIDMIAGPSEVLLIADDSARPSWVAADLLAQAEHDEDASLYFVTTSAELVEQVQTDLENQLKSLSKSSIASKSVANNGYAYLVDSLDQAMALSNAIGPEHLELMVKEPNRLLDQVEQAGSVFLGNYAPEALGDYYAGTNHTLPTNGTSRFSSPLGVYDFIKRPSFLSYSKSAFEEAADSVAAFAEAEGLTAHQNSILIRLEAQNA